MKITKTVRMRIVRPFYPPEVEERIAAEKEVTEDGDISGKKEFWQKLKADYPNIITWDELDAVLKHLQSQMTGIYNRAASAIYSVMVTLQGEPDKQKGVLLSHGISDEDIKELTKDGKKVGMASLLSRIGYPQAYEATQSSAIALGLRQKLQSSFKGENLKQLKSGQRALPTARSNRFPIAVYSQQDKDSLEGGFKISEENSDFVINIPFPHFEIVEIVEKEKGTEKDKKRIEVVLPPQKGKRKVNLRLLLSTKSRRRRGTWQGSAGTDAEVRRLMSGEYRTSWIEIMPGRTLRDRDRWFVNITYEVEIAPQGLDKGIVGGIDIGIDNPIYCAVSNSLKRFRIGENEVRELTRKQLARLRSAQVGSGSRRTGHGKKRKFKPIEKFQQKYFERRKKVIERWAKQVADFFVRERAGVVQMEKLDSLIRKKTYFDTSFYEDLRLTWPIRQMRMV